jgi:hypothetical protein
MAFAGLVTIAFGRLAAWARGLSSSSSPTLGRFRGSSHECISAPHGRWAVAACSEVWFIRSVGSNIRWPCYSFWRLLVLTLPSFDSVAKRDKVFQNLVPDV